ncbi:hypothetical protein [Mycetocola miduiensis]|uniref:Uncharacterized protein n=1 Tax=Mycetocola miduiensis TaxID=995034 RepID=A0A1I5CWF6_9MICO|nr:hypothetical protein [Mycetocola miduiensis]SFN90961.1 hypothetical protein SAMN05216219_2604 [Mycetocola miduiensis]
MIPSALADFRLDDPFAIVVMAFGAVLLLTSIPVLQWRVLRCWIQPALFWIPANVAGWAFGILWTLTPSLFIDDRTAPGAIAAIFVTSGLRMAFTVAAITAFAARKVIRIARLLLREDGDVRKMQPTRESDA